MPSCWAVTTVSINVAPRKNASFFAAVAYVVVEVQTEILQIRHGKIEGQKQIFFFK
jgi:hypothetical protein